MPPIRLQSTSGRRWRNAAAAACPYRAPNRTHSARRRSLLRRDGRRQHAVAGRTSMRACSEVTLPGKAMTAARFLEGTYHA
jgi:hypothetical protein